MHDMMVKMVDEKWKRWMIYGWMKMKERTPPRSIPTDTTRKLEDVIDHETAIYDFTDLNLGNFV